MRSVKFLVAAGAASLLSSAAFAADMAIAPPPMPYAAPVADFGGWYLRGDIGFSNQSVKYARRSGSELPCGAVSGQIGTGFDSARLFDVGVGYQFNNWFSADVTGQYRGSANFTGSISFTDAGRAGSVVGRRSTTRASPKLVFLANAYVDLGTWWCVTPVHRCRCRYVTRNRSRISGRRHEFTSFGVRAHASFTARGSRSGILPGRCTRVWPTGHSEHDD